MRIQRYKWSVLFLSADLSFRTREAVKVSSRTGLRNFGLAELHSSSLRVVSIDKETGGGLIASWKECMCFCGVSGSPGVLWLRLPKSDTFHSQ